MKLSEHFDDKEFFDKDTYQLIISSSHAPAWHISPLLINRLEKIREHFGKPIHINSGFRTQSENIIAGSIQMFSMHQYGIAADIVIKGVEPKEIFHFIVETWTTGGVGRYDTFIHIDVRNSNSLIQWTA